jgi:asparagine synthase (glutamine-hydrolysing)
MCGILGFVGTRWREHAAQALASLKTRGPDEQSVLSLDEAVLCHARLAVIDLAGGHQPMQSPDGRYTIVFNGEIYNFIELRKELEAKGFSFATRSDTEVLLHGYAAWGEKLLDRLDGMFAFSVWDARERRLFAARDTLGIKPFMYAAVDGGLVFASTLAPFLALPDFPRRLDPEALRDYLAFQTPLSPHTFLRDVRQLPPAHLLRFNAASGRFETVRYWSIPGPRKTTEDRPTLVARIDAALREIGRAHV